MRYTLFISDLHLSPQYPEMIQAFKDTLKGPAQQADALYILGDFFDVCIGDDDDTPFYREIIHTLKQFTHEAGVPTYFMKGNRDFLIGTRFAKQTGVTLLGDPTVIHLYQKKIVLLHGDTLCTADKAYQRFRKFMHHPLFHKITYAAPLFIRRAVGNKLREKSKKHNTNTPHYKLDVTTEAVNTCFTQTNADLMIHGHTHRPKIHPNNRVVLGAWHDAPSVLYVFEDGHLEGI